jgi:inhibitor of cysteine peptidase
VAGGDLSVDNVETVPGRPLNQFSLSEHNGSLRITTTIPAAGGQDSRNDLYVLDASDLSRQGEVTDMGLNERVYSVRYVGDTAYIVTFRRVDPFHVVDLSNPNDPELDGELKLPGFSTYLHPIDDDRVLGIGKEDGQVKAVMFDVSDPSNPTVQDDFILDSHWSAIDESHHAFLLDKQHGVFFLPTGGGGNIIDYTGGELELETQIDTGGPALRAMYIDDYMYVFGGDELTVVDEQNWERIKQLKLGS